MKHTTTYHTVERWVKNAANTAYKHMTYDNALKALMVASVIPVVSGAASAVRAGVAARSVGQVVGGLAQGLSAASYAAPALAPAAQTAPALAPARGASSAASGVANSMAREQAARRAQGPMTAQAYLNRYNIPVANRAYGTESQYQTAMARMNR